MNITRIEQRHGACTITTTTGRFERWPGREHQGRQWWSFTPTCGSRPTLVTVPETVDELEEHYLDARGPAVAHLRLVKGAA